MPLKIKMIKTKRYVEAAFLAVTKMEIIQGYQQRWRLIAA
jgi:hypothetical protein